MDLKALLAGGCRGGVGLKPFPPSPGYPGDGCIATDGSCKQWVRLLRADRLGVGGAEMRVCARCLLGPVGAGAERRNNPLTKHGNINQHQSLERRPLAPTSRYCLHLHPARKNVMLDRDIDGPVSPPPLPTPLSNAAIDPSGPSALHIILLVPSTFSNPSFSVHYTSLALSFLSSERRFSFFAEK